MSQLRNMKQILIEKARVLGFAELRVMRPERLTNWHSEVQKLEPDPLVTMPDAKSVIQLIYPYQPFSGAEGVAAPNPYYLASHLAHNQAVQLAAWLVEQGYQATQATHLPQKALAEKTDLGRYGRNGLIAARRYGSRIVLQSILTTLELEPDAADNGAGFSPECENCAECVSACPTGALSGNSAVDITRCLRNHGQMEPFPEEWRQLIGSSMFGCDICQACCPRNASIEAVPMPEQVADAFALERIIAGDVQDAAELIGRNNARPKRMIARGIYVAVNLGRRDLLPVINKLIDDESRLVRDAAHWAVNTFR